MARIMLINRDKAIEQMNMYGIFNIDNQMVIDVSLEFQLALEKRISKEDIYYSDQFNGIDDFILEVDDVKIPSKINLMTILNEIWDEVFSNPNHYFNQV